MSATIFNFPIRNRNISYNVKLFNEEEADVLLICVNTFSNLDFKFNYYTLDKIDSALAINCLDTANYSTFFSKRFKNIISNILNNVELTE